MVIHVIHEIIIFLNSFKDFEERFYSNSFDNEFCQFSLANDNLNILKPIELLYPFLVKVLYPLKMVENLSVVFRGYKVVTLAGNGLVN